MSPRYKATRSLHYVDTNGEERLVDEGEWVEDASESKVEALLADGLIRESRAKD